MSANGSRGVQNVPLLSICIASMGRPSELNEQVNRLLEMTKELPVEIVIVDASKAGDRLERKDDRLRVIFLDQANGIDADYDLAVQSAQGTYCWLFTDDDQPDPDAAHRIITALLDPSRPSLVLVDARVSDPIGGRLRNTMLDPGCLLELPPHAEEAALAGTAGLLTYIGSVVIERTEWLSRRNDLHLGSEFQHVGFILAAPFPRAIRVLTPPAINIKYGVAHWEPRSLTVWTQKWPQLIRSTIKDPALWVRFSAASLPSQAHLLLTFRARKIFDRSWSGRVYPLEKPWIRRGVFLLISKTPVPLARFLVLSAARALRQDARALRFDIQRSKLLPTAVVKSG
jgi:glycosyltransferase involved in cell wall biosynthesis